MYMVITLKNAWSIGIILYLRNTYMYLQTLFTGSQEDHEVIPIYIYICVILLKVAC